MTEDTHTREIGYDHDAICSFVEASKELAHTAVRLRLISFFKENGAF